MKQLALALALSLAVASLACGGSQPAPASSSTSSPPSQGPSESPPNAGPAAPTGGCAQEIALRCQNGVDGCMDGRTTEHVCVPADAKAGPPCEQEIAMVCPEGQIDGCLRTPRVSASHICVYK